MSVDVEKVRAQLVADWQAVLRCWLEEDEADRELFQEQMAELEEAYRDQIAAPNNVRLDPSEIDYLLSTARAVHHRATGGPADVSDRLLRQAG